MFAYFNTHTYYVLISVLLSPKLKKCLCRMNLRLFKLVYMLGMLNLDELLLHIILKIAIQTDTRIRNITKNPFKFHKEYITSKLHHA